MTAASDAQLSVELSRFAAQHRLGPTGDEASPTTEQLLASITTFDSLARISTVLQGQAVQAAHDAGVSWARIGALLGTSRQAVQQRFDPSYAAREDHEDGSRILGPVTRAEEMHHLAEAGRQGWRLVRSLHGEHMLERDEKVWDVKRVSVFSPRALPSRNEGWAAASTRFPDCFYIRPQRTQ